jgi:hypothetical protein
MDQDHSYGDTDTSRTEQSDAAEEAGNPDLRARQIGDASARQARVVGTGKTGSCAGQIPCGRDASR